MTPVVGLREAESELQEAIQFYENRCGGLGLDLAEEIKAAIDLIQRHPDR